MNKKIILVILLIFLTLDIFSQDIKLAKYDLSIYKNPPKFYEVINPTFLLAEKDLSITNIIVEPNIKFEVEYFAEYFIIQNSTKKLIELCKIETEKYKGLISTYDIMTSESIPLPFDIQISNNYDNTFHWISNYSLILLDTKNRNEIFKFEQGRERKVAFGIYPTEWYEAVPFPMEMRISNLKWIFQDSYQMIIDTRIKSIKKIKNNYLIQAIDGIDIKADSKYATPIQYIYSHNFPIIDSGNPIFIIMELNNSKLRLYNGKSQRIFMDLIKVTEDFFELYINFMRTEELPKNFTIPSELTEPWPGINIAPPDNKDFKHKLIKDSKLFSEPDLNSNEIEQLHIGAIIRVMEPGVGDTIEGLKSNWVWVETKNKNQGWMWSGFLKEIDPREFPGTHKVLDTLRLRQEASQTSVAIAILRTDDLIILLETGKTETIDGISAPWVKVENEKGQVGWCFSGYLEALEKEGDNKQEIAGMTDLAKDKATAGLPGNVIIILIAAGALLLGALIFFLIRKKT